MCQSAIKSSVCPGPRLPHGSQAGGANDTRCRGCKNKAGQTVHNAVDRVAAVRTAQNRTLHSTAAATLAPKKAGVPLGESWARFAETFLIDIFDELCGSNPPGEFALAVAGSLARKQATPYSDLEFFFTVKEETRLVPFAKLARKMWKILEPVHEATTSFEEDK